MDTDDLSPAQRYAQFKANQAYPQLHQFTTEYSFPFDSFQIHACQALEEGDSVLVAAPTGAGKTIVGEFAVHLALSGGRKCFYTTPIKALSNQKFHDLVQRYGPSKVGLLTGDNSINSEAPIVVMTTEVLRNMLYAGSSTLQGLGWVVMDEVHYLADRARGAVWEEVIIHLPESVALACLSATVSNAEEFGEWLQTVRGATTTIVEETRPVPLYQHVLVEHRLYDLFSRSSQSEVEHKPTVNPRLVRAHRQKRHPVQRGRGRSRHRRGGRPQRRYRGPSRADVVGVLDDAELLPAIVFIFSRAGCDAAVQQCLRSHLTLTTPDEQRHIAELVRQRCAHIPREDLAALGYHSFLEGLTRGIAAHHAGMLPTFKECVEELFVQGLCQVVFATETLALGINMPARSVVLEKLSKWNGHTHADITAGEYTQLTGRAGRRGIDVEGHGVVVWHPELDPHAVAGLAATRTYPLRSSFRPSYNMAANLVNQVGQRRARRLLESSFAQFQADKAVVGLTQRLKQADAALEGYAEAAACERGDFLEYEGLRQELSAAESAHSKARRYDRRNHVVGTLRRLRPGDIIEVPAGKTSGLVVVVDPGISSDRSEPRPYVVTTSGQGRRLSMVDFPTAVPALARVRIPKKFQRRDAQSRRNLAEQLQRTIDQQQLRRTLTRRAARPGAATTDEIDELRQRMRTHPCHDCPEREEHARWARRWHKLDRDATTLRNRVARRTNSIARQFDRICQVLHQLGYLHAEGAEGELEITDSGRLLMGIYNELDLLTAEAVREGIWQPLSPAEFAAALSTLVYESRKPEEGFTPRLPGGQVRGVIKTMMSLWEDLSTLEKQHHLESLRRPDTGFALAAFQWAQGLSLEDVLATADLAAGDFVRQVKQILDLADQIAAVAPTDQLRSLARQTSELLRRGVVDYTSLA